MDQEQLQHEVKQLIEDTEDYEDAMNYVNDLSNELGVDSESVAAEIKRQYGRE